MNITNDVASHNRHRHHDQGLKTGKHSEKTRRGRTLKVRYISSPMKVKTCASNFRALVQELTGKESDVARLMEMNGVDHHHDFNNIDDDFYTNQYDSKVVLTRSDAPISVLDSDLQTKAMLFDPFGDVFASHVMNDSFTRSSMFPSVGFYESYCDQADYFKCFDALG